MKRLFVIFLLSAALTIAENGSLTGSMVQNSDTININRLLKVDKFGLEIIPPSSGVQFYRDGIVFLFQTKSEAKMLESHTSFGATEAYFGVPKDTSVSNPILFSQSFSWAIPCEAMTFNSDYSTMYFTRRPSNREPEKIYQARYQMAKNGKHDWISDTKPLSFCTDKSVYSHPALSADGEKMVFTSNRSESTGGLDLFISYKENSGWSAPINLGNLINSRSNELSPYLDQDNNLFFSSDRSEGFGGYDIYFCRYNGRGWEKPANLTRIINTQDDQLAFTLSRLDGKSGFYTTRYKTGNKPPKLFRIAFRDQYAVKELTNLSNAFRYIAQSGMVHASEEIVSKPEPLPENKSAVKVPESKPEVKPPSEKAAEPGNEIIYRIQFLSNSKPKGSYNITIAGKTYKTFEYRYNGLYKSCVGDYTSRAEADNLLAVMKKNGYPNAFVAEFRGNERATGAVSSTVTAQEQKIQKTMTETSNQQKLPEVKKEATDRPPAAQAALTSENIVFRVQFSSYMKSKGSYEISIGGKKYKTFEYMYNGAYRSCAGEFSTPASAASLQKQFKQEGYSDAFIIATKGNQRITDPALFKK